MTKDQISSLTSISEVVKVRDSFDYLAEEWHWAEAKLRELLKQKYESEAALCLKEAFVPTFIKAGFTKVEDIVKKDQDKMGIVTSLSKVAEYVPRSYAEYNPLYKQIIPYVIGVTKDGKIFTMQRIEGDDRLVGKVSIGIGGHINECDGTEFPVTVGIAREVKEEVTNVSSYSFLTFKGFLYDPSDCVGLDHIGFIFTLTLSDDTIAVKETDKLKGMLCTKEELKEKIPFMENWSRIVFENLF